MDTDNMTLEEKVDKILAYQKSMKNWQIVRTIMSLVIFIIFVVIPIMGAFWVADYIKNTVDFNQVGETMEGLKGLSDINNIKSQLGL